MSRILGLDYGSRRVGLALSDDGHTFAFPKVVLVNDEKLFDGIAHVIDFEGVDRIVLGEADNPAGGLNTIARRLSIFGEALKIRFGLPVEKVSEAYSSAEARRVFEESEREAGVPVDASAAAIILQAYLDRRRGGAHTISRA